MTDKSTLSYKLKKLGIKKNDLLFIHGDSIIFSSIKATTLKKKFFKLISELKKLVGKNGTIIIPTFTYSFTKTKKFDVLNSRSEIGNFSENLRLIYPKNRTKHPIFSCIVIGKDKNFFLNLNNLDSFGTNTLFDGLYKKNAKIVCLGCGFNRITFAIYVEQMLNVKYRFFKFFNGKIKIDKNIFDTRVRFFVRNRKLKTDLDLSDVKKQLIKKKQLNISDLNRIAIHCVNSRDFFTACKFLLKKNKYALIEERFKKKEKKSNYFKGTYV